MAITTFIPTVWSARLLAHLDSAHVATQFVNRDYQGDIQNAGDRVKINQVSAVTIRDYVKNTDMEQPETLSTAEQVLVVDQAKYFHFQVDDVDAVQAAAPLMDSAMERAAYGLAQAARPVPLRPAGPGGRGGEPAGGQRHPRGHHLRQPL